jgi:hypothetical protein
MTDEQQAALAVKDARIAELESGWDAETVKRQVADFNKLCDEIRRLRDALAAREAELATLRGALEPEVVWHMLCPKADTDDLGITNPVMVLARSLTDESGRQRVYVCPKCEAEISVNFPPIDTATPPRRTPEGDDALDDAARNLFAALCEGDGKHSEALDRRIIASHLDAYARRTTPPRRPPEPECDSCGERHLPQVMCPPHEVRRGTRNTMAVKPQGEDT